MSTKVFPYHDDILSIFRRLLPEQESVFSIARYTKGHFIDPHDDNAFKEIDGTLYERDIALIYYLTPNDWSAQDGGLLLDLNEVLSNSQSVMNTPSLPPQVESPLLFFI